MRRELLPLVDDLTLPPVELPPAAAVPVRVRDSRAQPVAGARVRVRYGWGEVWRAERRRGWAPLREAVTSDAAGFARAPHAAGEHEVIVDAFAPGFQGAARQVPTGGEVELVLPDGVAREVEVRRRSGPVPRAVLWVVADGGQWTIADERGRTRLTLPEGEPVILRVESAGGWRGHYRVRVERPPEDEPPPPLRFVLDPPVRLPLRIVAADTGAPLPGALAWMSRAEGAAVTADADGLALLSIPAEEDVEVGAASGGFQPVSLDLPAAEQPAAGEPLVLPLVALGVVAGEVADPSGLPIAGARVFLRQRWASSAAWDPGVRGIEVAESDDSGRFRIASPATRGEVLLRAEAAGMAAVEREAAIGATDVRLALGPGGAVSGRLRAADGGAIEGGEARLFPVAGARSTAVYANDERVGGLAAVPDAAGVFRFPQVAAGMHELIARVPGHQPLTVPGVEVADGGEVDLGRLDLRPEAVLAGRVLDAEERPVAGARVTVEQHWPGFPSRTLGDRGRTAESDEEGRFRLGGLSDGTPTSVRTEAEGFVSAQRHDVLLPRDEPLEVRLSRGGTIFGQVVDAAGEPLAGARLWVQIDRAAARHLQSVPWHAATGESGEDGRFEIAGVPVAPLRVDVQHARRRLRHEVAIGEVGEGARLGPLRIEVPASLELSGRVWRADGRPAAGAEVQASHDSPQGGSSMGVHADALGRFRFPHLPPGRNRVVATLGFEGRAEAEVSAESGPRELELVLEPTTGIGGRVVDAEGRPVRRGYLRLRHEGGERGHLLDELGRFAIVGLDEGTYRLAAEVDGVGRGEHPEPLVVRRGAPVEGLVIALAPGARIAGRVVGVAAGDLPQLRVWVSEETSHVGSTVPARPDGSFEVRGLAAGRYTVTASLASTGRSESIVVEVASG
ncbi:MAG TPA: carboxypeptidase-like regulatory domain-containing protein, partial [Thermoanaerobaculia bacterium]